MKKFYYILENIKYDNDNLINSPYGEKFDLGTLHIYEDDKKVLELNSSEIKELYKMLRKA